jgi:hypothetical protein
MNGNKTLKEVLKHSTPKFPPIVSKKDVVQCMYCEHYDTYDKECKLYSGYFPMKRKPYDFCSYGTVSQKWLKKMGLTEEEINTVQNGTDEDAEDILKEILK